MRVRIKRLRSRMPGGAGRYQDCRRRANPLFRLFDSVRHGRAGVFKTLLGRERGFSLMETLCAVFILGVVGVGFLQALSTTSRGTGTHEKRVIATSLAQSQLEVIRSAPYDDAGPLYYDEVPLVECPANYSVSIETVLKDTGRQEVTANVYQGEVFVLEMTILKVSWE